MHESDEQAPDPGAYKPRIMVVEDEAFVVLDIASRLRNLGYEVVGTASSESEAVEKAQQTDPDLVLMDIRLRGDSDGIAAATRIREMSGTPVIFLTAYSDEDTLRRAKVTEPFGYIVKPIEEQSMRAAIEMALYKSKQDRTRRQGSEWVSTILGSMREAVLVADVKGRIQYANPTAEVILKLTDGEIMGKALSEVFRLVDSATGKPTPAPITGPILESRTVHQVGSAVIAGDGTETPIDFTIAPLRNKNQVTTGIVIVFRTPAGSSQATAPEAPHTTLGQLAAGIAHYFNNFLMGAVGHTQLLSEEEGIPEDAREKLRTIVRKGFEAGNLVQQILDFGQSSMLRTDTVDFLAFAESVVSMVQATAASQPRVTVEPRSGRFPVTGDIGLLERALFNVLKNAMEATKQHGAVTVQLKKLTVGPEDHPPVTSMKPGTWIATVISDTGVGISDTVLPRVFEPFFTTKEVGEGTGMGLPQAQGIIRQHGGFVQIASTVEKGTTVTLYLPAEES